CGGAGGFAPLSAPAPRAGRYPRGCGGAPPRLRRRLLLRRRAVILRRRLLLRPRAVILRRRLLLRRRAVILRRCLLLRRRRVILFRRRLVFGGGKRPPYALLHGLRQR